MHLNFALLTTKHELYPRELMSIPSYSFVSLNDVFVNAGVLLIKFSSLKELKKIIFHFFSKWGNTVFSSTGQTVKEKKPTFFFFNIIIIKEGTFLYNCLNKNSGVFKARPDEAWSNLD